VADAFWSACSLYLRKLKRRVNFLENPKVEFYISILESDTCEQVYVEKI
jgi:hypothetical protein